MSIVPVSRLSLEECSQLGNNTVAAALRERLNQHRPLKGSPVQYALLSTPPAPEISDDILASWA